MATLAAERRAYRPTLVAILPRSFAQLWPALFRKIPQRCRPVAALRGFAGSLNVAARGNTERRAPRLLADTGLEPVSFLRAPVPFGKNQHLLPPLCLTLVRICPYRDCR